MSCAPSGCWRWYLGVPKGHIGAEMADVVLTGVVQLGLQTNVLRLRRRNKTKNEIVEEGNFTV